MRHGWSSKQCLWLGPGGYRGRCRNTFTNGNTDSYPDRNSYAFCMRGGVNHANANCHTNGERYADPNSHSDSYQSHANSNSSTHGYTYGYSWHDWYASTYANTAASSDGSAAPDPITAAELSNAGTHEQNSRLPSLWRIGVTGTGHGILKQSWHFPNATPGDLNTCGVDAGPNVSG
jgi:hypothetical protein